MTRRRLLLVGVAALAVTTLPALPTLPAPSAAAATTCDPDKQVLVPAVPFPTARLGASALQQRADGRGVTVAVVDSGVNADNVHLKGALVPGTSLVSGDSNGGGTLDVTSHGTAVAGLIAARPVPGSGLVGLAPGASILPVRVYASEEQDDVNGGRGPTADRIAAGIRFAADHRARIIVVPLSLPQAAPALTDAVGYATGRGSLVVASSGNKEETPDLPDGPRWPAADPGVLGVGASDENDQLADGSVTGPHVDVLAPGTGIVATFFGAGDCVLQPGAGVTSWAAAYAAAAAADVAQVHPTDSPAELAWRLETTADRPVRSRRDDQRGWGLIAPLEAVDVALDPDGAGPPLPGSPGRAAAPPPARAADIRPLADPAAERKATGGWWLLGGAGALGLGLLGTAASRRIRRRPASATSPRSQDAAGAG